MNKRVLLGLAAIVVLFAVGLVVYNYSQEQVAQPVNNPVVDVTYTPRDFRLSIKEMVDLPNDEDRYWVTIVRGSTSNSLIEYHLRQSDQIKEMMKYTRNNIYTQDSVHYLTKLKGKVGTGPMLFIQAPEGKMIFKTSGDNIPQTTDRLEEQIRVALMEYTQSVGRWCRPKPEPKPDVTPPVEPEKPLPDTVKKEDNVKGVPFWVYVIVFVIGLGAGVYFGYARDKE